jgi:Cu/Ag efflux protein CusF
MKLRVVLLAFSLLSPAVALHAQDHAAHGAAEKSAASMHPLKGVIVDVFTDKSALLVKHEEIPGVMRAMTMLFLVDAETVGRVKKGDAITAQMGRNENKKWILRDVKVVTPAK